MNSFKFVYGLHLSMLVLNHSVNLSATLRTPDICAPDVQKTASRVIETLQKLGTSEQASKALHLGIDEPEPCLPQRKKTPP